MSLHQHKNSQTKIAKLAFKAVSPVVATVLIAGMGVFSYFNFTNLTSLKVAQAACPAGTYANPGTNTFGTDPYGGEACLPYIDFTTAQLANTLIVCGTDAGGSVIINTTTNTCKFTLPANTQFTNGLAKLGIGGANPAGTCTANNSGLVTCANVPAGSTIGTNTPVIGSVNGATGANFANGVVTTDGKIADAGCTIAKPCFLKTSQFEFTPKSSSVGILKGDQTLTVKSGLFSKAAASGNKYVCRISLKTEGKLDTDALLGFEKQTTRLVATDGSTVPVTGTGADAYKQLDYGASGCAIKLPKDSQVDVKWYYRIVVGEINSSGAFIDGSMTQAEPSYFFNYGGALSLISTVTPIN